MIGSSATGFAMAPTSASDPPPAALAAFLRGCERRGAVFAAFQCGDPDRGDVALAAALRAFRAKAAALPMADWPVRFWSLLAATPQLRADGAHAHWSGSLAALANPAPADRAALLLRLAGGLQEAEAAQALGFDNAAYRDALARACPRDAAGHPDAAGWRALAEAIQQHLRELPPDRLATLARLREDALAGTRIASPAMTPPAPAVTAPLRRWPWILLVALLLLVAGAAGWWWWDRQGARPLPGAAVAAADGDSALVLPPDPVITVVDLPAADAPAVRADAVMAAHEHADFALLADADEEALAREADFLAWYVAGAGAPQVPALEDGDVAR
jgi:hypothetical protein